MILLSEVDYGNSGLSISRAFLEARKEYRGDGKLGAETLAVMWNGRPVIGGDIIPVPNTGTVEIELISKPIELRQGVDIDVSPGSIKLPNGSHVPLLRTWFDDGLPTVVKYSYESPSGVVRTCNVYEVVRGDRISEEQWTMNAGMLVEKRKLSTIYHCSHGVSNPPDFENLVYRLTVNPTPPTV